MEIQIKPEDIESYVKDALIKSSIGKTIQKAIDSLLSGYRNPIEEEVRLLMAQLAKKVLVENYQDHILQIVQEKIKEQISQEVIEKATAASIKKMLNYVKDYG